MTQLVHGREEMGPEPTWARPSMLLLTDRVLGVVRSLYWPFIKGGHYPLGRTSNFSLKVWCGELEAVPKFLLLKCKAGRDLAEKACNSMPVISSICKIGNWVLERRYDLPSLHVGNSSRIGSAFILSTEPWLLLLPSCPEYSLNHLPTEVSPSVSRACASFPRLLLFSPLRAHLLPTLQK